MDNIRQTPDQLASALVQEDTQLSNQGISDSELGESESGDVELADTKDSQSELRDGHHAVGELPDGDNSFRRHWPAIGTILEHLNDTCRMGRPRSVACDL